MNPIQHGVLIVYNKPRVNASRDQLFCESEAGVLDEVRAVAQALSALHVPSREAAVSDLHELMRVLLNAPEQLVFNLIESFPRNPEDACLVPTVCRVCGKGCTGTDTPGLLLSLDKWQSKAVLQASGLPCPRGVLVAVGQDVDLPSLFPGPYIVKPVRTDASESIDNSSVIPSPTQPLLDAVRRVHAECRQPAIIEQFIDGREINVSILWHEGIHTVLPLAEIDFSAYDPTTPRIVGYDAKWLSDSFAYQHSPRIIPALLPPELTERIRDLTVKAARVLGCCDYARVDFRLDSQGRPFILEVNCNPDISPDAGFPAALAAAGIGYAEFVSRTLNNAAACLRQENFHHEPEAVSPMEESVDHPRVPSEIIIRWSRSEDRWAVLRMLEETAFFRPDELAVAREVLDDALIKGPAGHYQSYVAERNGSAVGWVCFGIAPCTQGSFEVYWIVVSPACQKAGVGRALMQTVETVAALRKGRQIVIETSGRSGYEPTWTFYAHIGYQQIARIADFYAPGDDMIVFSKSISPPPPPATQAAPGVSGYMQSVVNAITTQAPLPHPCARPMPVSS